MDFRTSRPGGRSLLLQAFGLLVCCAPSPPPGSESRQPDTARSSERRVGSAAPAVSPETAAPAVFSPPAAPPSAAKAWKPPELRVERGKCWVRLFRLPDSEIEGTLAAFRARNPGWEIDRLHVDPYTGYVTQANRFRRSNEIGPPAELPQQEYERRRLEPLIHNADLIGMTPEQIAALQWKPGGFRGHSSDFGGSTARANIDVALPEFSGFPGFQGRWLITVRFQRDGMVSGFSVRRSFPPLPLCTKPRITAEQARRARGITDASAHPGRLGCFAPGFTVKPHEIEEARLTIDYYLEDCEPTTRARSVTWRLVWAVDVKQGLWTFLVDAVSGEVVGLRKNFRT